MGEHVKKVYGPASEERVSPDILADRLRKVLEAKGIEFNEAADATHVMQAAMDFVEGQVGSDAKTSQTAESARKAIGEWIEVYHRTGHQGQGMEGATAFSFLVYRQFGEISREKRSLGRDRKIELALRRWRCGRRPAHYAGPIGMTCSS